MPIMIIIFGLQYLDKVTYGVASLFGSLTDLDLVEILPGGGRDLNRYRVGALMVSSCARFFLRRLKLVLQFWVGLLSNSLKSFRSAAGRLHRRRLPSQLRGSEAAHLEGMLRYRRHLGRHLSHRSRLH
jgi:hypothetical protein